MAGVNDDDCLSMLSWCLDPRAPGLVPAPQRIAGDPLSRRREEREWIKWDLYCCNDSGGGDDDDDTKS